MQSLEMIRAKQTLNAVGITSEYSANSKIQKNIYIFYGQQLYHNYNVKFECSKVNAKNVKNVIYVLHFKCAEHLQIKNKNIRIWLILNIKQEEVKTYLHTSVRIETYIYVCMYSVLSVYANFPVECCLGLSVSMSIVMSTLMVAFMVTLSTYFSQLPPIVIYMNYRCCQLNNNGLSFYL